MTVSSEQRRLAAIMFTDMVGYSALAQRNEALALERAVQERAGWLPELKMEPTWDPVRSNPRFTALLKKVGLEK